MEALNLITSPGYSEKTVGLFGPLHPFSFRSNSHPHSKPIQHVANFRSVLRNVSLSAAGGCYTGDTMLQMIMVNIYDVLCRYLACVLLLSETNEFLRLIINSCKVDLASANEEIQV